MSEHRPMSVAAGRPRAELSVQLALGAILVGYLVWHGARHWAALGGRDRWALAVGIDGPSPVRHWVLLVGAAYLAHGALLRLRLGPALPSRGGSMARWMTAAVAAGFVVLHLSHSWSEPMGPHRGAYGGYDTLMDVLGQPAVLVGYVVGVTAAILHVALGLDWAAAVLGERSMGGRRRLIARLAGGGLCVGLWLAGLHLIGHFANGEGLLP